MISCVDIIKRMMPSFCMAAIMTAALGIFLTQTGFCLVLTAPQQRFATPEEAFEAMVAALQPLDPLKLKDMLGPDSESLINSGDNVADQNDIAQFIERYRQAHRVAPISDDMMMLYIGSENWPFPIPVINFENGWVFDTASGAEEILARRIGKNELSAIQVCLAYVDAQREYAAVDRDGNGIVEYAQKFTSDSGHQNGLYWPAEKDAAQSPLGPSMARASEQGYDISQASEKPTPYHGYYYRILKAQGPDAPGGAYDYMLSDKMIGGFAVVAYPARYGVSGIMTFITNHDGRVYQKDLGEKSTEMALAMTRFNPDSSWQMVAGTDLDMP